MNIRLHSHAKDRLAERGAIEEEALVAVREGERFPAKYGRAGFRHNFPYDAEWRGRVYATKQAEADAVDEDGWLVITVLVKSF